MKCSVNSTEQAERLSCRMDALVPPMTVPPPPFANTGRLALAAKAAMGAGEGLAVTDPDGRFVFMNPAQLRLFGFESEEQVLGRSWEILYGRDEVQRLRATGVPELIATGRWQGSLVAQRRDGSRFSLETVLTREADGCVISHCRDEEARRSWEREALAMIEQQERYLLMQREFVSLVSHEFRTPLATAQSVIFLLERELSADTDQPKLRRWMGLLKDAMATQRSLVDQVLLLNRLEAGTRGAVCPPVDIREVIGAMVEAQGELHGRERFQCEIAPDTPAVATLNLSLLRLVVEAFLTNATKHSPQDSRVVLRVRPAGPGGLRIAVFNECGALSAGDRSRIWEPFFRGAAAKNVPGVGLGLPIVRRAADLMGARVGCDDAPGGLEFWLEVNGDD